MATNTNNMDLVPEELIDELKSLDTQLGNTKKNLESLLDPLMDIVNTLNKASISSQKLNDTIGKLNEVEKKATTVFKEQEQSMSEVQKLQQKLIDLSSEEAKQVALLKEQIKQKNKENRDSAKAIIEEMAALDKFNKKLKDTPESKSVSVTTEGSSSSPDVAKQAEQVRRTIEQIESAFRQISEEGFTDISVMLQRNRQGMIDYSGAINAVSTRLALVTSVQKEYTAALEAGTISQEEYARKIQVVNSVETALNTTMEQLTARMKSGREEAASIGYSTDAASHAFTELSERAQELTKNLIELNSDQITVKNSLKELETAYQSGTVAEDDYIQQKAELNTLLNGNSVAIKAATRELALEVKATNTAAGSYDNLSARYSLLKIRLNEMTAAGKTSSEEFRTMQEEAAGLYERMKELQSATGKDALNVGNYPELSEWLEGTISGLSQVPGAAGAAAGGFRSLGAAAKALLANPVVAFFAAIIAVLSTLYNAFKKSETGSRMLEKAGNTLKAVMMVLTGIVDKVAKGLKAMFEDPGKALDDFGVRLKNALLDRLKAAGDFVISLKDAMVALFKMDFDKVKDSLKDAGDNMLKFTTGVNVADIQRIAKEVNEVAESVGEYTRRLNELTDAQLAAKNQNEALTRQIADLNAEEAKYSTIAQDVSKSYTERTSAEEKAYAAAEKRSKMEYQIAKTNFDLIKRELELRQSAGENVDELKTRYTEAYVAMRNTEQQYINEREKSQQRINKINLEFAVKELDRLTESTNNMVAINIKRANSDQTTYDDRKNILEESRQTLEKSLAAEVAVLDRYAKDKIKIDSLVNESDQTVIDERVKALELPTQIQEKMLKVIKDYRQQRQNLNDAEIASERKHVNELLKEASRKASIDGQNIAKRESGELADLSEEYAKGLHTEEEYQKKRKEISDNYTKERFRVQSEMLKKQLKTEGLTAEQRSSIEAKIAEKSVELDKWTNEQKIKDNEDAAAKLIEIEKEKSAKIKELLQDVFNFGMQLINQQFEAKLDSLEKESEENEAWSEEEKERIDRLEESGAISKEQADARKAAVDDQAAMREEEIEAKRKEVKKKQAMLEKNMAVIEIAKDLAVAIFKIKAEAAAAAAIPVVGAALAAAALSQIPLVVASAAVQTAAVLATPIPEYAKGTKDHPGGLAIVGDGGRSEMIVSNGMLFKTPATDTLIDLPAHSVVYPDFNKAISAFMTPIPRMPEKEDKVISFEALEKLMKENNNQLKKSIGMAAKDTKTHKYLGLYNFNKLISR